jgi:DNA-directed RNA polymerase specialized sigma24 family protein
MRLELLATRHRSLAVTACEWRAFELADPEQMADAVFDRLLPNPDPNLADFYAAVDEVVRLTFARHAAQASVLERLSSNLAITGHRAGTDEFLQALSQLRTRHRLLLQLRHWDGLSEAEAAEALELDLTEFAERQAKAEARFIARVTKRHPELLNEDVGELVASAKPGKHTRQRG